MTDTDILLSTLEQTVNRLGDPSDAVYDRLFATNPHYEPLFKMDQDGGVRGSMLEQAFDCLIDLSGDGRMATVILSMERENHESYGVPDDGFMAIYDAIYETVRSSLGKYWTPDMQDTWNRLLRKADTASRQSSTHSGKEGEEAQRVWSTGE